MKKSNVFILGMFGVLLTTGLVMAGCDDGSTSGHTHSYSSTWSYNATSHYKECSCGEKKDIESHIGNPCAICGYSSTGGNNNTVPGTPTGVTASRNPAGSTTVRVTWDAVNGATSYKVYYSSTGTGSGSLEGSPTGTSFDSTGNSTTGTHYFRVSAVNSAGEGSPSSWVSVGSSVTTPSKASYLKGAIYVTRINMYWFFSSNVENVVIEAWNPSSRSWTTIQTLSGSENSYDFYGYGSYITGNSNGPQGLYAEHSAVFMRVRGKNGSVLGPAKATMFDTLYGDVIEDLLPVYEN